MSAFGDMLSVITVGAAKARAVETGRVEHLREARLPDLLLSGASPNQMLDAIRQALGEGRLGAHRKSGGWSAMTDLRILAACGALLGLGLGLLWAGGILGRALAEDDRMDVFTDDGSTAYGPPVILPDPTAYDAPGWMR